MTLSTQRPEIAHKQPGAEPLPGYRLLLPLGRGGFGEVWKCEAPGGLHKAIKFVAADGDRFRQELSAFEQIKSIRHPFLLGLDRVELSGGELVMVMELADCQFHDRFRVCKNEGQAGIPRPELVGYMEEVAEALDMIGSRYDLQHLDVKPENLFIVAGHAKVGDYGLVRRTQQRGKDDDNRGFTPRYTAPEVLIGRVDSRSDQYSLALVYAELLTGHFPYTGQNAQQLMLQHLHFPPDLSKIHETDRSTIAKALSKEPSERFPSCLDFVRELLDVKEEQVIQPVVPAPSHVPEDTPCPVAIQTVVSNRLLHDNRQRNQEIQSEQPQQANREVENYAVSRRSNVQQRLNRPLNLRKCEPPPADPFENLFHIMPVNSFLGSSHRATPAAMITVEEYVDFVVQVALENQASTQENQRNLEGILAESFLCTLPTTMLPLKLAIVSERWGLVVEDPESNEIVLWRECVPLPKKPGKSEMRSPTVPPGSGLEVIVRRPVPPSAEVKLVGRFRGLPHDEFARVGQQDLPQIMLEIRSQLQNLAERRVHPRIQTDFQVLVYPLYPDGIVGEPIGGCCRDISVSGIRLSTTSPIRTERFYVEFHQLQPLNGQAVYVRVLRTSQDPETKEAITAGRFHIRAQ